MAEYISVSKRIEEEGKSIRRKIWKYTFLVFVVSTLFCAVLYFLPDFRLLGLSGLLFFYGLFIVIASLFVLACMGVVCYLVARERQEDERRWIRKRGGGR